MNWQTISTVHDVEGIIERSHSTPCLILKHSTRCPISSMAMRRLENNWDLPEGEIEAYYLDLIRYREVSNYIATTFAVDHQSPQILVVKDGICIHDASHLDISVADLKAAA